MTEELGKIEKPPAEPFKKGRKVYLIPLIHRGNEPPADFVEKFNRYWNEIENQMFSLELKLGRIARVYHELIPVADDSGLKAIKELNEKSYQIVINRLDKGARLEALEEVDLLTELMDWSRCLVVGLQNQSVAARVYGFYVEANRKRTEHLARRIDETLGSDESAAVFLREGHQVQFPPDIEVFYVNPPALDEIRRWLRDREKQAGSEGDTTTEQ